MSGFVSFVGSGPGDPELLTVKAVKRLKEVFGPCRKKRFGKPGAVMPRWAFGLCG